MPFIIILIFGALAGSFALIFELLITSLFPVPFTFEGIFSLSVLLLFFIFAFIEEISKFVFLFRYKKYSFHKNGHSLVFFIILALLFGIGFSSLETIFSSQNIVAFSFFAIWKIFLVHISTSFLFIYFILHKQEPETVFSLRNFWLVSSAILVHLSYNIILFLMA